MTILCLCGEEHHWKMLPPFARAFRARGVQFVCVNWKTPLDTPLEELLQRCSEEPAWILHFESALPLLPEGLARTEIPTVCLQVDTYAFTRRRMRWSSLFDHVGVFHPKYDEVFRRGGHPGAFVLPHAIDRYLFDRPHISRDLEVGWVGQTSGPVYRKRAEWIPKLAKNFGMNNWTATYSLEEVANIYRRSRIVVNIGRDDFPQDANMRVFEVMASGALLVTSLPNELTDLGFRDGVHFVGYSDENDVINIVNRFLGDEPLRSGIANSARTKVLREHTYDCRVEQLLNHVAQCGRRKLAPARAWSDSRVRLMYLDFFAGHGAVDCARSQFRRIVGRGFQETIEGTALLCKAWLRLLLERRARVV